MQLEKTNLGFGLQQYPRVISALLWFILVVPACVEIFGFRSARLFSQELWTPQGLHHLSRYLVLFAVVTLPIAVLFRSCLIPSVILVIAIGSIGAAGVLAACSVLAFVFSASVLGRLVFGKAMQARLAFMAGLALWILGMNATARLPIHYAATYWIALLLPVLLGRHEARQLAFEWLTLLRPRPISFAETAAFLLLAFVMMAHWLIVLKPEASTDGLAMHLVIPMHMARSHVFELDFRRFSWALMPLGTDFSYAVLYTLGGEYAARLLNFTLLTSLAVLLFDEARRLASHALAIFVTALFLSTPLVQLVTGSLFVENFVAAMCLAGVVALWTYRETRETRYFLLTALLLGCAISLKLAAFAVVLVTLPFFAGIMPKRRLAIPVAAGFLAIACMPYLNAWWRSGNPVFPYANSIFHSAYVGNDLVDVRFHPKLSVNTPLRLTLNTHDYFEGQNGAFGFQYFLLLPLTVAYALSSRSIVGRSAAVIGVGGAVIIAATQPNARYFYPVLPFLALAAAASLSWLDLLYKRLFYAGLIATSAAAMANIYFFPASNYQHRDFYSSPLLRASGRHEYLEKAAPVREVIAYLNRNFPHDPVFYADGSLIAGLLAPAYRNSWHDYAFMKQVEGCETPQELYRLLNGLGIRHMIINDDATDRPESIAGLIAACGESEYRRGNFSALHLRRDCEPRLATKAD